MWVFLFLLFLFSVHQSQQVMSLNKHLTSIPITVIQVEMYTCCLLAKRRAHHLTAKAFTVQHASDISLYIYLWLKKKKFCKLFFSSLTNNKNHLFTGNSCAAAREALLECCGLGGGWAHGTDGEESARRHAAAKQCKQVMVVFGFLMYKNSFWELHALAALLQSVPPMGDGMRNWHLALTWTSSRGIQLVRAPTAAQTGPRACASSAWGLAFKTVFLLLGHWMVVMFMLVQGRMWC